MLVVGVGNDLRRDDGVGRSVLQAVRRSLAGSPDTADTVITHQLLPELLEEFIERRTVIVVDAAVPRGTDEPVRVCAMSADGSQRSWNLPAGVVLGDGDHGAVHSGRGENGNGRGTRHVLDLSGLLALGRVAGITVPLCWSVTVPAFDLGIGEGLSGGTLALVDRAAHAVLVLAGAGSSSP